MCKIIFSASRNARRQYYVKKSTDLNQLSLYWPNAYTRCPKPVNSVRYWVGRSCGSTYAYYHPGTILTVRMIFSKRSAAAFESRSAVFHVPVGGNPLLITQFNTDDADNLISYGPGYLLLGGPHISNLRESDFRIHSDCHVANSRNE